MEKLLKTIEDKVNSGKRLFKDDLAYQLSCTGGWSQLPFCSLLDFKRSELVDMFNKTYGTDIK